MSKTTSKRISKRTSKTKSKTLSEKTSETSGFSVKGLEMQFDSPVEFRCISSDNIRHVLNIIDSGDISFTAYDRIINFLIYESRSTSGTNVVGIHCSKIIVDALLKKCLKRRSYNRFAIGVIKELVDKGHGDSFCSDYSQPILDEYFTLIKHRALETFTKHRRQVILNFTCTVLFNIVEFYCQMDSSRQQQGNLIEVLLEGLEILLHKNSGDTEINCANLIIKYTAHVIYNASSDYQWAKFRKNLRDAVTYTVTSIENRRYLLMHVEQFAVKRIHVQMSLKYSLRRTTPISEEFKRCGYDTSEGDNVFISYTGIRQIYESNEANRAYSGQMYGLPPRPRRTSYQNDYEYPRRELTNSEYSRNNLLDHSYEKRSTCPCDQCTNSPAYDSSKDNLQPPTTYSANSCEEDNGDEVVFYQGEQSDTLSEPAMLVPRKMRRRMWWIRNGRWWRRMMKRREEEQRLQQMQLQESDQETTVSYYEESEPSPPVNVRGRNRGRFRQRKYRRRTEKSGRSNRGNRGDQASQNRTYDSVDNAPNKRKPRQTRRPNTRNVSGARRLYPTDGGSYARTLHRM